MLEIMFPGVLHGKTQMQIYKYSLYLNIVNDEMSVLTLWIFYGTPLSLPVPSYL